ncbi:family 9 glycosyl hydrolase [Schizopora paradoxa]|uniref:cellulase n=1 Tax=Schizopora paradoxa TaxID=27342 RepID=A0A0H2REC8_9AGAM|nr:family 9 glycosyl hydrolase [Schizopora paradoxa]
MKSLLYGVLLAGVAFAQVPFPNPQYLPPDASEGTQATQNSTIPNPQWSNLLGNALFYYDAQRSGKLPSTNRVSWRNDSCLTDGSDVGLDLSGGYYDAGDYIKATYPLSFTLMSTCWGALQFGQGYEISNQTAYLDSMLRWGLDWIIKAHPENNTLYVLVADIPSEGNYWGGDLDIPTPRTSYQINDTHPGTDAAAQASAAFSSCALLYSGVSFNSSSATSIKNDTYASLLLSHAQSLYSFAASASGGQQVYQNAVPEVADAYSSSGFQDDMVAAELFLGLATNSSDLIEQASQRYLQNQLGGSGGVFNWDSKTPGLAVLFSQIATTRSDLAGNLTGWQTEAERYFDDIVNDKSSSDASLTGGGLLWYNGDSDEASLNPALNAAMLMSLYSPFATSSSKSSSYETFAGNQLNYALGNNPMSSPYVVGMNPNSPQNPHSALASGGDNVAQIDSVPAQEAYVLYGAVIGGPDKNDRMYDIRSDWPEMEPALDLNAPMLTLAALHVMNDAADPFFVSLKNGAYASKKPSGTPCDAAFPCKKSGLSNAGKIALAIVLSLVGVLIIIVLAFFYNRRRAKRF